MKQATDIEILDLLSEIVEDTAPTGVSCLLCGTAHGTDGDDSSCKMYLARELLNRQLPEIQSATRALLREALNENHQLIWNLSCTQARCTELLLENRTIRRLCASLMGNPPSLNTEKSQRLMRALDEIFGSEP